MDSLSELLGVLAGAVLAVLFVTGSVVLPSRPAQPAALVGYAAFVVLAGVALVTADPMGRSFGAVYLALGGVCALLLAAPRWRRWTGREQGWVPLGLGLTTLLLLIGIGMGADGLLALLLAPESKAATSTGLVNGLLLGAVGAVVVHVGRSLLRRG
ncbi:hypothetical protein E7T09_20635 [Deinococcus sp. KSM4-11]|uniref:hypothetical protein n=1 Tax=Deinococcus sp. KSM4-11 TaxID=2568654 RepID=UPI0010A2AFEE|nr:hypothetical protein [Deinococcus sp. KSM4-11]THF83925.1 hypothetical protein E7T09_20635 [Deinococcus sp. KSM4-11]